MKSKSVDIKLVIDAYWLLNNRIIKNASLFALCSFVSCLIITFCVSWDYSRGMVKFLNFHVGLRGEVREYAMQFAFYDYFLLLWVLFGVFFVPKFVLSPLSMSYSVSNSLWIKTSNINPVNLHLIRVVQVLVPFFMVLILCFLWQSLFSFYHNIPVHMLYEATLSLSSYVLFAGALIVLFKGRPTDSIERRQSYIMLAMLLPFFLYFIAKLFSSKFFGLLPFAFPVRANQLSYITLRGQLMAILLSLSILILPVVRLITNRA